MFPQHGLHQPAAAPLLAESNEAAGDNTGDTLEDAARDERDYVRERLRDELRRDPTDEEISDWLRKHTEGY
ncbi:MAG TPA: hypothetical protein VG148_02400 [Pyrinomonadaceae bacterium]|nr:hypothetical protein [Pyrinomonadaceae bacterium]